MRPDLTPRQKQILEFIAAQVDGKGYPPSVREIGQAAGLRSSSTVHGYLARLEEQGYIRRDPTKPRAIEILQRLTPARRPAAAGPDVVHAPIVGKVTAGLPILAVENIEGTFPVPADLTRGRETFVLRVRGESMTGAGICDGDLVIVRRQDHAENGDIVVAMIGDEATIKRFFRAGDRVRLQAENPAFPPIYARDVAVVGKVVGLFRHL